MMLLSSYYQTHETDTDKICLACEAGKIWLSGQVIEHQFEISNDKYLLFISDNEAFEGILTIYLLSKSAELIDAVELGQGYADGILKNVKPLSLTSVQFSYFNEDLVSLDILSKPTRVFSTISGARYLRSLFNKRYINLTKLEAN